MEEIESVLMPTSMIQEKKNCQKETETVGLKGQEIGGGLRYTCSESDGDRDIHRHNNGVSLDRFCFSHTAEGLLC